MYESRRAFLGLAFGVITTAAVSASAQTTTDNSGPVIPPQMAGTIPRLPRHNLSALRANQQDIKKDVAKLSQLVGDLKKGLDDNDTKEVLSLDVIHTTEQIEKLAKQIRELVRA